MSLLRSLCLLVAAPALLVAPFALVGCAQEDAPAPAAPEVAAETVADATEDGTADANDWQHQASANLSCDEAVDSSFSKKTRRHYFSFAGAKGQKTSFSFDGSWQHTWGSRIYVTDVAGKVIGTATSAKNNAVSLAVTFPADGKYFVYVSASNYKELKKTYAYELVATCAAPAKPVCATVRLTQGVSSPTYYAHEFANKAAADTWLKSFASGEKNVADGECATRPCTKIYKPVCGVIKSGAPATYGNACTAESSITADAGNDPSGESKGYYTDGACIVAPVCDYESETRHYVAKSREQCKLVKFRCNPGEQGFADDCGCGCEPSTPLEGGQKAA